MKKIYRQFFYIITLLFLFLVGLYSYTTKDITLGELLSYSAYPFLKAQEFVIKPIESLRNIYRSNSALEEQISFQREQIAQLQAEHIELLALKDVFEKTKELREFSLQYGHAQAQLVRVLFRQLNAHEQFFLIDAGSHRNIIVDTVLVYKNCLVGRVTQVYPQYSKVTLITDKSCKVAAFCAQSQVQGIHEGLNTLNYTRLVYVNHLSKLQLGDYVISSGEGLIFPRGFGLGRIKKFELEGFDYNIEIEPLLDLKTLEYCYVVSKDTVIAQTEIAQESRSAPDNTSENTDQNTQEHENPV